MAQPTHQTVRLSRGKHRSPSEGVCVMELASMLAGEPFSDEPQSVCPVVASFLRVYNDRIDDERRQDLYAYAAKAVGSRATKSVMRKRARLCRQFEAPTSGGAWRRLRCLRGWKMSWAGFFAANEASRSAYAESHREALRFVDRLLAVSEPSSAWSAPAVRTDSEEPLLVSSPSRAE